MSSSVSLACLRKALRTVTVVVLGSFRRAVDLRANPGSVNPRVVGPPCRPPSYQVVGVRGDDANGRQLARLERRSLEIHDAVDLRRLRRGAAIGTAIVVLTASQQRHDSAHPALVLAPRDLALQTHQAVPAVLLHRFVDLSRSE